MALRPTSRLTGVGWLRLAVTDVRVDDRLPDPIDTALRTDGFIRVAVVGGSPEMYVPARGAVITAECWIAPSATTGEPSWSTVEQLAERVVAASYDPALTGRLLDLTGFGDYAPARVTSVAALSEPVRRDDDPSDFARFDVDLLINWRPET